LDVDRAVDDWLAHPIVDCPRFTGRSMLRPYKGDSLPRASRRSESRKSRQDAGVTKGGFIERKGLGRSGSGRSAATTFGNQNAGMLTLPYEASLRRGLFVVEGFDGVDAHGTAGGEITSQERDDDQRTSG